MIVTECRNKLFSVQICWGSPGGASNGACRGAISAAGGRIGSVGGFWGAIAGGAIGGAIGAVACNPGRNQYNTGGTPHSWDYPGSTMYRGNDAAGSFGNTRSSGRNSR